MEIGHIIPHIEALIFASEKPLTPPEITDLVNNAFGFMEDKITIEQVETSLDGIVEKYNSEFYPFEVRESGGGWQFLTKRDYHKTVAQLNGDKFMKRLSAAAMETLAIIAYKQPITKSEIESIRGVSSDYAVQKLLEKDLVVISGRNEEMPGKPLLYGTSKSFMDYFGINTPEELPKIREVLAELAVEPTVVMGEKNTENQGETPAGKTAENSTFSEIRFIEETAETLVIEETVLDAEVIFEEETDLPEEEPIFEEQNTPEAEGISPEEKKEETEGSTDKTAD